MSVAPLPPGERGKLLPQSKFAKPTAGSIKLTVNDVTQLRLNKIDDFNELKKIWSLKYGEHIASALTVASTSLVHLTYRDIFRIRGARTFIGLLPTFVLGTLIPSVCCAILLNNMHMLPMLGGTRREANECPLCGELKANASMFAIGAVFPTFISWSMCMFQAEALKSYTVPPVIDIMKSVRGYFRRVGRLFAHTNKRVYPLVLATSGAYFVMCGGLMAVQRYQYERYIEPLEFTKAEIIAVRMSKGQEV